MNDKKLNLEDLSLEEILKEFGGTQEPAGLEDTQDLLRLIDGPEMPEENPVPEERSIPALEDTGELPDLFDKREKPEEKSSRALEDTRDLLGMFDDPEEPEEPETVLSEESDEEIPEEPELSEESRLLPNLWMTRPGPLAPSGTRKKKMLRPMRTPSRPPLCSAPSSGCGT